MIKQLPRPTKYSLVAGTGESKFKLNAFDKALLNAGVGNLNLLRVSSILPPGCEYVNNLIIPEGSLTPIAYGSIVSDNPGELISAAVAIGYSENTYGVIMEHSQIGRPKEETEKQVVNMVKEGFEYRNLSLVKIESKAIEYKVVNNGCTFAAVVMWY